MSRKETTLTESSLDDEEHKDMLPLRVRKGAKPMEISRHVTRELKKVIYPLLELPARYNYQWGSKVILDLVLNASRRNAFLEDTAKSVRLRFPRKINGVPTSIPSIPTARTVFNRLKKIPTEEWKQRYDVANHTLLENARKARKFKGFVSIAVDIHDIPYYGKKSTKGIVGTKRKLGTCWAFRYMTVCVTAMKDHYTLAGSPMTSFTSLPKMLKKLLDQSMMSNLNVPFSKEVK